MDFSKYTYSSFVDSGAATQVKAFMDSALDVSKNAVLSATGQAQSWDENGIRLRKWNEGRTDYAPEQIWMINNNLVFTDDNWQSAKMALGQFVDAQLGSCWGISAPNIVGTLLAGKNLIIESQKQSGDKAVFKVDEHGAVLYNSTFDLYNGTNTQITLNPKVGLAIGAPPLYSADDTIDTTKAKFWLDTQGNIHMKGTLDAADGKFTGIVQAQDFKDAQGNSMLTGGKFSSAYLDLGNIQLDGVTGDISMTGKLNLSGLSSINFGNNTFVKTKYSTNKDTPTTSTAWVEKWNSGWTGANIEVYEIKSYDNGVTWVGPNRVQSKNGLNGSNGTNADVTFNNILTALKIASSTKQTFITADSMGAANIYGANIYGGNIYAGTGDKSTFAQMAGDGFYVYHKNADLPKVSLISSDSGDKIQLILGAGGTGAAALLGRFFIDKDSKGTELYYLTSSDRQIGFRLDESGAITPLGDLKVTAIFA